MVRVSWLLLLVIASILSLHVSAMPSPEKIAKFKKEYQERLDTWLDTKNGTRTCIEGLIRQLDRCRHEPYS